MTGGPWQWFLSSIRMAHCVHEKWRQRTVSTVLCIHGVNSGSSYHLFKVDLGLYKHYFFGRSDIGHCVKLNLLISCLFFRYMQHSESDSFCHSHLSYLMSSKHCRRAPSIGYCLYCIKFVIFDILKKLKCGCI